MLNRATSLHIFSAAVVLAVEARFHAEGSKVEYLDNFNFCLNFLDGVKDQSIIAARAVNILRTQFPVDGRDELEA